MKKLLSLLFVIAVFSGLVGSFMSHGDAILGDENRARVRFPDFDIKRSFKKYFEQIDLFASDNFPSRDRLISGYRWMVNFSGDQVDADKAFRGRDNWLFLGNIYNRVIEKLERRIIPNPEHSRILNRIISLSHWFQQRGVKVVFVLGPNKSSVYQEKLPAIIMPSSVRYVAPFLERLHNSGIDVVDPTAVLLERKSTDFVYFKDDTHWNQIGSWVAFKEATNSIGIHDCPSPQFEPIDVPRKGDLINIGMFEIPSENSGDNFRPVWGRPVRLSEQTIEDTQNSKRHEKTRIINNPHPAHEGAIFLIGDSFRSGVEQFVSMCFARTVNLHINRNSNEKIQAAYEAAPIKPSYVMIVLVERSF